MLLFVFVVFGVFMLLAFAITKVEGRLSAIEKKQEDKEPRPVGFHFRIRIEPTWDSIVPETREHAKTLGFEIHKDDDVHPKYWSATISGAMLTGLWDGDIVIHRHFSAGPNGKDFFEMHVADWAALSVWFGLSRDLQVPPPNIPDADYLLGFSFREEEFRIGKLPIARFPIRKTLERLYKLAGDSADLPADFSLHCGDLSAKQDTALDQDVGELPGRPGDTNTIFRNKWVEVSILVTPISTKGGGA